MSYADNQRHRTARRVIAQRAFLHQAAILVATAAPEQRARALQGIEELRKRPDGVDFWLKLGKHLRIAPHAGDTKLVNLGTMPVAEQQPNSDSPSATLSYQRSHTEPVILLIPDGDAIHTVAHIPMSCTKGYHV